MKMEQEVTDRPIFILFKQRCRDGVINDFLSWHMHLLVPFPPSFQSNDYQIFLVIIIPSTTEMSM